ncbi:MAG: ATP-dependent RecD-like DNA helicase [Clostridia bacterium]|nr:ATP-dependent RecD-like DNA helicase [Clostridia bacterium]
MSTERGTVEYIIFRNEENGYTVMQFLCEDGTPIVAVGCLPQITEGEVLELTGDVVFQPKRGEQFVFESVNFIAPAGKEEIARFLSSGLFPLIGPVTAKKIVDFLGEKTLSVLDETPDILKRIKGIGEKKGAKIAAGYRLHKSIRDNMFFLQKYGISLSKAFKICEFYGEDVKSQIEKNPYSLIEDIEGIGFITADKIAETIGIDRQSEFRIIAGIRYILGTNSSSQGNTCLGKQELIRLSGELLQDVPYDSISEIIPEMLKRREVISYNPEPEDEEKELIALPLFFNTEKAIAKKLMKLKEEAETLSIDVFPKIKEYEDAQNIYLHQTQKEAISKAINEGVMVITGGPGTGKTTIIKCIIQINESIGKETVLAAPTGRASKRLEEATGKASSTIHRLLGVDMNSGSLKFIHGENNPLTADMVILDEVSMADIFIFNALIKAMKKGGRLVIVGDKDQLPSVAAGNILGDIISTQVLPVIYLTEIYRQEAGSLIVENAHRINSGNMPLLDNKSKDFYFLRTNTQEEIVMQIKDLITSRLPSYFSLDWKDMQVLSPTKKGFAGVSNLNKELQTLLNRNKGQLILDEATFKVGDRVMQTVNNYDIEWVRHEGNFVEDGKGIFNGEIGFISNIVRGEIEVLFEDGKKAIYGPGNHSDIMLAYAVSVHKSQGCEFPIVILALCGSSFLMNRNLLYTAVTRARNAVVIVGSENDLAKMVKNVRIISRKTLLKYFLLEEADAPNMNSASKIKEILKKRMNENIFPYDGNSLPDEEI